MPTLETPRLLLRDFTLADWEAVNALLTDPLVTRYMHFAAWDEQRRREWLDKIVREADDPRRGFYNWAITLRNDGALIGWFGIGNTAQPTSSERGCGYALNSRYWGHGYMPEAACAIFAYEFTIRGAKRIFAECEVENIASARVMQKSGMTFEGEFYEPDIEGDWDARYRYAITVDDWSTADGQPQTPSKA